MKPATLASACFAIVLLTGSAVAVAISPELDRLIVGPSLWNMSASDFMLENAPIGFGYESQRRDCARSVNKRLTFLGQPIWEALVYFETGAVKRVEISLYNRGDAGALEEANFRQRVQVLNGALSHWAGSTVTAPDETTKDRANYVTSKRTWIKPPFAVQLSQAYVEPRLLNGTNIPFRSEFVKVAVQRLNSDAQVVKDATTVSWMPGAGAITIPGLVKIEKKKVPAQPARKNVENPFKKGEFRDVPAKPASSKVKVRALKTLKDWAK